MGVKPKDKAIKIADCEACIKGKMTRRSFKRSTRGYKENIEQWTVGEKAHTDIWGPYHTPDVAIFAFLLMTCKSIRYERKIRNSQHI